MPFSIRTGKGPMKSWKIAIRDALLVGSVASLTSLAGLALRSRAEDGRPWPSVNAPSHWLWGNVALRQDEASWRYTLTGLLIHHASSGFWGVLHEKLLCTDGEVKPAGCLIRDAALTTAVAAWVDLRLVPHRLTPGFQRRLSSASLFGVYALFGIGLALGSHLASRRRHVISANPR